MWEEEPAIRLIIDFPIEEYAYLKKLAEKRGMNMSQYVIESLCENMEKKRMQQFERKYIKKNIEKGD